MPVDPAGRPTAAPAGERRPTRTAGPFGFSRPEIIVLSVVALIVIVLSVSYWLTRRNTARALSWSVEDILIDTLQAKADVSALDDSDRPTIDVNTASRSELLRLPGIGDVLADRIIASREKDGPFTSLIDFQRVPGIGPKKAAALAGWVRFAPTGQTQ